MSTHKRKNLKSGEHCAQPCTTPGKQGFSGVRTMCRVCMVGGQHRASIGASTLHGQSQAEFQECMRRRWADFEQARLTCEAENGATCQPF